MPILLLFGGGILAALLVAQAVASASEGSGADHPPDYPPNPPLGKTGYRRIDAILPDLKLASDSSRIPLGLLVGWIAKESGGNIKSTTKLGEVGYFQLSPDESKSLGLDVDRLRTDSVYSINGGLLLVGKCAREAADLQIASYGTSYFWRVVKLLHTMGSGSVKKIVEGARAASATASWETLEKHALDNEATYFHTTGHSPLKWFPLVDKVYAIGAPFGFGSESAAIVGAFDEEIPDPLALL